MPLISSFYGIKILMYPFDHLPKHFHNKYTDFEATMDIETSKISQGFLPGKAEKLVKEWVLKHKEELLSNWEILSKGKKPEKIKPLW